MDSENRQPNPAPKFPAKVRKRARRACLSCRARKVRCDVSLKGPPCMNCHLDNETCIVTRRASKYRRAQYNGKDGIQKAIPPYASVAHGSDTATTETVLELSSGTGLGASTSTQSEFADILLDVSELPNDPSLTPYHNMVGNATPDCNDISQESHQGLLNPLADSLGTDNVTRLACPSNGVDSPWVHNARPGHASDVLYCYYPFLTVTGLGNIPPEDLNFLEAQGCLRVPVRSLLDEFIRQYFLRIHPILPLVNEGDFWELYAHDTTLGTPPKERISLLLLQAMLFASSNFISKDSMTTLGYRNIRSMRSSFLRRAKLLYDLGSESSPLSIAQTSLLLSFTGLSSSRKPNTMWLNVAIENAKLAEAHVYAAMPSSALQREQNTLKRVWWCCVIRDRSIGLLMRRPIQITQDHFDFKAEHLDVADLSDEFERSNVYTPEVKRLLAEILALFIELCATLTDILVLVFPLDDTKGFRGFSSGNDDQINECKVALRQWHASATSRLSSHTSDHATNSPYLLSYNQEIPHHSAMLYTNLLYMYYHTTRIVLCHYEALHLNIVQGGPNKTSSLAKDLQTISNNQQELRSATSSITMCHAALVRQGIAQWLPISAIGCTALPLLLHIIDAKLFPSTNTPLSRHGDPRQHQLNTLIEVMNTYQPQYDGVDWIHEIVGHIVSLTQFDTTTRNNRNSTADWTDIFYSQPTSYLRLALALDLSLRKGRLPEDRDFPLSLRGSFVVDYNALKSPTDITFTDFTNFTDYACFTNFIDFNQGHNNCSSPHCHASEIDGSSTANFLPVAQAEPFMLGSNLAAFEDIGNPPYVDLANGLEDSDIPLSRSHGGEVVIDELLSLSDELEFDTDESEDLDGDSTVVLT